MAKEISLNKFLKWMFYTSIAVCAITILIMFTACRYRTIHNIFSDFGEPLVYCLEENPFSDSAMVKSQYPPIAFLIFYPFALICKTEINKVLSGEITYFQLSRTPRVIACCCIFYLIVIALTIIVAVKLSKLKGANKWYLVGILSVWGPFLYGFQRGNTILPAALFILLFFALYSSPKRWQKEISLVFLALSISIKIYPVVLALLLLKDRKYLDILKTAIYSIILVFLPFAFISGSFIENIKLILLNSITATSNFDTAGGNISIYSIFARIQWCLPFISMTAFKIIANVVKLALLICTFVTILISKRSKNYFSILWLAVCTYLLIPDISIGYAISFTLFIFIYYVKNYESFSTKQHLFYLIFFSILYCPLFYGLKNMFVQMILILFIYFISLTKLISEYKHNKFSNNNSSDNHAINNNTQTINTDKQMLNQ